MCSQPLGRLNPFGVVPKLEEFVNTIFVQARNPALVKTALDQVTKTLEKTPDPAGQTG